MGFRTGCSLALHQLVAILNKIYRYTEEISVSYQKLRNKGTRFIQYGYQYRSMYGMAAFKQQLGGE
jgi:hypothetical protein